MHIASALAPTLRAHDKDVLPDATWLYCCCYLGVDVDIKGRCEESKLLIQCIDRLLI